MTLADRDLARPSLFREGRAHEAFRYLRAHEPVSWNDGAGEGVDRFPGFWSVVKYEDVLAVSRDTATFSSARGSCHCRTGSSISHSVTMARR